jgi:hypothetical protein
MFRAVTKDPAVLVQYQRPQSAAASAKGPSRADRLIADRVPKPAAMRRKSERAGEVLSDVGRTGEDAACAGGSVSLWASVRVFIVKM